MQVICMDPSLAAKAKPVKGIRDARCSGPYRCPICGLCYKQEAEAKSCCVLPLKTWRARPLDENELDWLWLLMNRGMQFTKIMEETGWTHGQIKEPFRVFRAEIRKALGLKVDYQWTAWQRAQAGKNHE